MKNDLQRFNVNITEPYSFTPRSLKESEQQILQTFTSVFNWSVHLGMYSEGWKLANVAQTFEERKETKVWLLTTDNSGILDARENNES